MASFVGCTQVQPMLLLTLLFLSCVLSVLGIKNGEFSLGIRDSIMIAHSFQGEQFGPAQNLHGATYTVDAEITADDLVKDVNWVIDIGLFSEILSGVLKRYNFQHLNELFPNDNTTTEFMCKVIHNDIKSALQGRCKGTLSVKLWESHKAWASYNDLI